MRILILYTYNKGYLSSFFFELSKMLAANGHEIVNFALKGEKKEFERSGVSVIIDKKGGYLNNYQKIYKVIKRVKPQVVLSNFSYVNPALMMGRWFGVKKNMVWFHSLNDQMNPSVLDIFIKKQFLKLADILIANSLLTQEELYSIYKVPRTKLKALPFWSNISEHLSSGPERSFDAEFKGLKIGCPGRMVNHKNQAVVIRALGKLKKEFGYDFRLFFAGDGEDMALLQQLTEQLDLNKNVAFLKHLSANDMIAFYKSMDLIILPSLHEAFGLVFIEAISMGTPVLVSTQFGALSFIDNDQFDTSEFTFDPKSSQALQEQLKSYFMDGKSEHRKRYFENLYLKNFDKEIIFSAFEDILKA